jgi:hypothetical protein
VNSIHSAVCKALSYDDLSLQFKPSEGNAKPDARGFAIKFERKEGQWRKVLAEVRIRATCAVGSRNSRQYMLDNLLRLSPDWVSSLGKTQMLPHDLSSAGEGQCPEIREAFASAREVGG